MTSNLALTIAIVTLTTVIAGLGGHLASKNLWQKIVFWGCGVVIIVLVSVQAHLNDKAQEHLEGRIETLRRDINKNQNASVGLYAIQPHGQQIIPFKGPAHLEFNIGYLVNTNSAKDLRTYFDIQVAKGSPSDEQNAYLSKNFKVKANDHLDYQGQDRVTGTGDYKTLSIDISKSEQLFDGAETIYILGEARWVNPSGSDGHLLIPA